MARKLDELQKRYNSSSHTTKHIGPRHGGPGMLGRHQGGKPKKTKETIVRIISYLKNQKLKLFIVALCMMATTLSGLFGSYMLAPIINKISLTVAPHIELEYSTFEKIADGYIQMLSDVLGEGVVVYIIAALIILASIYLVGIFSTYIQSRVMLSVSQSALESIRNDLF